MIEKFNSFLAITVSSWLLALMVIIAEFSSPFKDFLTVIFSHHWMGKLVILIIVFLIVGFLFKEKKVSEKTAIMSVLLSMFVMFVFFVLHFLKVF